MPYKIVILTGPDQEKTKLEQLQKFITKFKVPEKILLLSDSEKPGIDGVLEKLSTHKESFDLDTFFITLNNISKKGEKYYIKELEVAEYFKRLKSFTGLSEIDAIITSTDDQQYLGVVNSESNPEKQKIKINFAEEFLNRIISQIIGGEEAVDVFVEALQADLSRATDEKKERKSAEPVAKTKVIDDFELEVYPVKKITPRKDQSETKALPIILPKTLKYKAVILIGPDHSYSDVRYYFDLFSQFKTPMEEILVIGNGQIGIDEILRQVKQRKDHYTPETLFMLQFHGNEIGGRHHIQDITTKSLYKQLVTATGLKQIKSVLTSCYGGGSGKRNEIPENVYTLIRGGRKESLIEKNTLFIVNIANLLAKEDPLTVEQALKFAVQSEPWSFYFAPFAEDVKDSKTGTAKKSRFIKIERVGKFSRQEIINIAREIYSESNPKIIEEITKEITAEKYQHKSSFSLRKINKILGISTKFQAQLDDDKEEREFINPEKYQPFLLRLRDELRKKLTPKNIQKYLQDRSAKISAVAIPGISVDDTSKFVQNCALMAAELGLAEELSAAIDVNPELLDEDDLNELVKYVSGNNLETIEMLIRKFPPSYHQPIKNMSLNICVASGYNDLALNLLKIGADPYYKNAERHNIFDIAVINDQIDFLKKIFEIEKDRIDESDIHRLLNQACKAGKKRPAEFLLSFLKKGEIDHHFGIAQDHMLEAIIGDHVEIVKLLLKAGSSPMQKNIKGQTPFMIAAAYGKEEIAELLINHEASEDTIKQRRGIALIFAIAHHQTEIAFTLLKQMSADEIDQLSYLNKDIYRITIEYAIKHQSIEMLDKLCYASSEPQENDERKSLILMITWAEYNHDLVKLLVEEWGEGVFDITDKLGDTILINAIKKFDEEDQHKIIELFLEFGANTNQQDQDGNSALLLLAQNRNFKLAKLLIDNGANINQKNKDGITPAQIIKNNAADEKDSAGEKNNWLKLLPTKTVKKPKSSKTKKISQDPPESAQRR